MDDNIWEYPFGEMDEDEEIFYSNCVYMPPFVAKLSNCLCFG